MYNPANEMRHFLKIVEGQNRSEVVQEGLWDKIKAWAGDEGAKARVDLEKDAKRMMKEFQRFSGPYEDKMRANDDEYFRVLHSYLARSFSNDVIATAIKRTQDSGEDMSALIKYLSRNGGLKTGEKKADDVQQGKKGDPDDLFDIDNDDAGPTSRNDDSGMLGKFGGRANESVDAPWNTITESVILLEGFSKKQLVTLFLNVILTAKERGDQLPAGLNKEMSSAGASMKGLGKRNGGLLGGAFDGDDEDGPGHSGGSRRSGSGGSGSSGGVAGRMSSQILADYRRLMGGDERASQEEVEILFSAIRNGNKFNTMMADGDMQKRLAAMGYAFLRHNKDRLN